MSSEAENSANCLLSELKKHISLKAKASILDDLTKVKDSSQCTQFWKYFEKHGGSKLLVQLLRYQDLKIINLALSILANACMNPDSREKVRNTDIAKDTLKILDLKVNDNLQCRACRLIGNLADCSYHAKAFCDAGVVKKLGHLLNSKLNTATQLMAIRALRNIWSSHSESRQEIIGRGVIKKVITILVESEKKPREKKYSDLTETCLKAILAFISTNIECATQMDNDGFRVLVAFCEMDNKLAIKCLCRFALSETCRPPLGNAGAVEAVLKLITTRLDYFSDLVHCLHLFSHEAVNRHRIHTSSGLQLILDLLKKKEHEKWHHLLLGSLNKFLHHEKGIHTMVNSGLIDVLAENFERMVLEEKESNKKLPSKKRSRDNSPLVRTDIKFIRTITTRNSADHPRDDWSPSSGSSGACTPPHMPQTPYITYSPPNTQNRVYTSSYTPPYTPPNSPPRKYLDADFSCQNDEEIYSPVCSDNEWSEEELQEEIESIKSFSAKSVERAESLNQEKVSKALNTPYMNYYSISLLRRLSEQSLSDKPIENLADPSLIGPVTKYVKLTRDKRVSQALMRILQIPLYFTTLIKQSIVFELQNFDKSLEYTRLLSSVAETGGAEGELSSILLRGQETNRYIVAVSIPYLIKSKEKLRKLLCKNGALPLIFDVLYDNEHSLHKEAVQAVCQLAYSLGVRPDVLDKSLPDEFTKPYDHTLGREIDYHGKPATVTLELDDGRTVEACRMSLCQRSEVFSNLLEGSFSESGKRRVRLKKTSKEGLEILLMAVKGSTNFEDQEIDSLFDAVVLADQFLMGDISEKLTESSMSMLNYRNICKAWSWARDNKCQDLKTHCVKSFLVDKMTRIERQAAFKDFSVNNNFKEFLDQMKEIISTELEMR